MKRTVFVIALGLVLIAVLAVFTRTKLLDDENTNFELDYIDIGGESLPIAYGSASDLLQLLMLSGKSPDDAEDLKKRFYSKKNWKECQQIKEIIDLLKNEEENIAVIYDRKSSKTKISRVFILEDGILYEIDSQLLKF